ncbi:MAG: tetratricopeptide repeat protein [Thermomicrobiales bacterium]
MANIPAYAPALLRIDRLLATGEYDEAVEMAEALVAEMRAADTLRALGRARFERSTATFDEEEHEAAFVTLRDAATLAPDDTTRAAILADLATMLTGSVFFTAEKEEEAVRRYKEAYALDPTNIRVLIGMTVLRAHPAINASRGQAIAWVEQAIAQGAPEWWHWSELGKLYEEEGDHQKAIAAYEEMLALFPFRTGHPLEFVMRQQRKHLQALRAGRLELINLDFHPPDQR